MRKFNPTLPINISTPWGDSTLVLTPEEGMFAVEYLKDLNHVRAARALGRGPEWGVKMLQSPRVEAAIAHAAAVQFQSLVIDKDWLLNELVDNHYLARQADNIGASNQALMTIGKLATVDAFAAEKVQIDAGEAMVARLQRGRERARQAVTIDQVPDFDTIQL